MPPNKPRPAPPSPPEVGAGGTTPPWSGRALHFIGIGGAGMSGLALVTHRLGARVTGSDRAESAYTERLRAAGIVPLRGHDAGYLPRGAEAVVSTAIGEDNPELRAARERGVRVIHRGELLSEVAALRRSVAISGTHGKTTTASMAAHALVATGHDPAYLIGGELRSTGANAAWGEGGWAVVEADESDRSFLRLRPDVAVVTNMELDHHATYRSTAELEEAFAAFLRPVRERIVWERLLPGDSATPERDRAAGHGTARLERGEATTTFGIGRGDLRAEQIRLEPLGSRFSVESVEVRLQVPGRHNVLNALAALAACRAAGLPLERGAEALAGFTGAGRRFEDRGSGPAGARVFDDYAHHPTEVRATLEAARTLGARRVVACFQPHLYSRTRRLARELGSALALADLSCVLAIYPARERQEDYPGVSGWLVATAAADAAGGRAVYWTPTMDDAEALLRSELREDDLLLTLGAGDVDHLAARLTVPGGPS
ncbi:MAG TPA: UDP-N-acetylmuramate--L-alanine ligase [Thermoleophilaceae bacterium]|nr:UDP-N-acetylmuramate--L-alanine ligase [Thermoleophilaceae bacterium]